MLKTPESTKKKRSYSGGILILLETSLPSASTDRKPEGNTLAKEHPAGDACLPW